MGLIGFIIFGGIAGWIASMITKNNKQMGIIANVIVGLLGSIIGGFIASELGFGKITEFSIRNLIIAIFGSVILLWIVNFITGKRR